MVNPLKRPTEILDATKQVAQNAQALLDTVPPLIDAAQKTRAAADELRESVGLLKALVGIED